VPAFEEIRLSEIARTQGIIRYRELGSGEPVVVVHGLLTNSLQGARWQW
jgi:hypothetical protein